MAALEWDQVGDRRFETGVDRCVLYLSDGTAVAWNGITSVEEQPSGESQAYYLDGVKYLERQVPGDYVGSLKALTYPQEFDAIQGVAEVMDGLFYHNQPTQKFNLCYRTLVGNDVDGTDHGYKLHILYNLIAIPDSFSHQTLSESPTPTDFSWTLRGTPKLIAGYRPTVHISIDSTETDAERLAAVEALLYGSESVDPMLPDIDAFTTLFDEYNDLTIVDNLDGTWTAYDPGNSHITMLDAETFEIDEADVTYLDADTYEISDTDPDDD